MWDFSQTNAHAFLKQIQIDFFERNVGFRSKMAQASEHCSRGEVVHCWEMSWYIGTNKFPVPGTGYVPAIERYQHQTARQLHCNGL